MAKQRRYRGRQPGERLRARRSGEGISPLVVAPVDSGGPCSPCVETAFKLFPDGSLFWIDPLRPVDDQVDEAHREVFCVIIHVGRVEHVRNKVANRSN